MSADNPNTQSPTPSNYQRTTDGNFRWEPPTVERLQELICGYEVIEMLGVGGMGAVYKARQVSLDRLVAIKILPPEATDGEMSFVERFRNEARMMAKMNHPAIVSVYDFGECCEGQLYIIMEFINGTDVAQMIRAQTRLPPEYALAITAHVCDALQYAHTHGIVHRDIKPANVLINTDGQVKVADFGLAKASDANDSGLTKTNMAMGTPDFVAPEALMAGVPLDGRADLYAVGVMLYNMLTGEIPRGLWMMPSLKLGTDPRFDAIIAKALQTDRENRYQSALEIRGDLDRISTVPLVQTGGQSSAAVPAQVVRQQPASTGTARKVKAGPFVATAATVAALAGLYAFFTAESNPESAAEVAASVKPATSAPVAVPVPDPVPAPAPPENLPPLPEGVEKQRLDLLAITDPVQDRAPLADLTAANEWEREGEALVFRSDGKGGKLAAPVKFDCRDYEIELHAVRLDGMARVHLDLPIGNGRILPLVFHDPARRVIDGRVGPAWSQGSDTVHISVRVKLGADGASDRVLIQRLDEPKTIADWSGAADSMARAGKPHPVLGEQAVASLSVPSSYRVQTWQLRVFQGEAPILDRQPKLAAVDSSAKPAASAPAAPPDSAPPPPATAMASNEAAKTVAPADLSPVAERLAELEAQFAKVYEQQAGKTYIAAVAKLDTSFVAALDRALATATRGGDLDEALAVRAEKERVTSGQSLPPADLETLPQTLKSLRATYRQTVAQFAADRDKAAAPLYDYYDQALARYQAELTQQQQLDEALKVKVRREEVAARKPQIDADVTTPANADVQPRFAGAKSTAAKDQPSDSDGASASSRNSRWYEAARWTVSVGGSVTVDKNGQIIRIEKEAEIPAGRFDILTVTIGASPKSQAITDDDFARFSGLRELQRVEVRGIRVTDAAFAFLPTAPAVAQIVIANAANAPVTDGILSHLAPLPKLTELQIADAPKFTGAGLIRLASLSALKSVWFAQSGITDEGVQALGGAASLEHLRLDGGAAITDEGIAPLGRLAKLRTLSLGRCPRVQGAVFAEWRGMPSLQLLHVGGAALEEAALAHIATFKGLEDLSLDDVSALTDETLPRLAPLTKMRRFSAVRSRVTGTGFAALSGWKDLTSLVLHYETPISGEGLAAIAGSFPRLEGLHLGSGTTASSDDLAVLSNLKSLKHLEVGGAQADDAWFDSIGRISSIESLYVPNASVTAKGLAALKPLKFLRTLNFNSCPNIDDSAVPALKELKTLRELQMPNTNVTEQGAAEIQKALPACRVTR